MRRIELLTIFILVWVIITSLFISISSYVLIKNQQQKIDKIEDYISQLNYSLSWLSIDAVILETNE